MPRPHPPEFRQRVELARLREKPVAQIATDSAAGPLGLWLVAHTRDWGKTPDPRT